jgi:hypothetical protein
MVVEARAASKRDPSSRKALCRDDNGDRGGESKATARAIPRRWKQILRYAQDDNEKLEGECKGNGNGNGAK